MVVVHEVMDFVVWESKFFTDFSKDATEDIGCFSVRKTLNMNLDGCNCNSSLFESRISWGESRTCSTPLISELGLKLLRENEEAFVPISKHRTPS